MYLSQLILNPRSRQVRSEVSQPYEMHRTLLHAFPAKDQGGPGRVLFRLEPPTAPDQAGLTLLVQSDQAPDWAYLADLSGYLLPGPQPNPACKAFDPIFTPGQRLAFRLRANPTKRLMWDDPEHRLKKGQRLGLYTEEAQRDWLARKAEQGGFAILGVQAQPEDTVGGVIHRQDGKNHDLNLLAVRFDGLLQVVEPTKFLDAVRQGIGSGKGLGFGLLSLARG